MRSRRSRAYARRGGVSAADDGETVRVDESLGDRLGALGVVGVLEDAHGTVPEDGRGVGELARVQFAGLRADVEAQLSLGHLVGVDGGVLGGRLGLQVREARGDHDVDREHQLDALLLGALQVLGDSRDLVLLQEGGSDLVALGLEEGEGHAAADEDAVGLAEELVDDGELVGDLGAAERHDVGAGDVLGELLQDTDLGGDEEAGVVRQPLRQVEHRGVLAVHGAEAVADVDVGEAGQPVGEGAALSLVLGGLPGVEAQVLQDRDLSVGEAGHRGLGGLADRVLGEGDVGAEEFTEAGGGRGEEKAGSGAPLGRPRCEATITRAPASDRALTVGTTARMRPSSVIVVPDSGTLRSARTKTRLPATPSERSSSIVFMQGLPDAVGRSDRRDHW